MALPEVSGHWAGGSIGLQGTSTTAVNDVYDMWSNPPTENPKSIDENSVVPALHIDFKFGLLDQLDFYYNRSTGLRYQFIGRGREEGWKAAAYAGVVRLTSKEDDSVTSGSGAGTSVSADSVVSGMDYGLSFGYRENIALYYFGLSRLQGKTSTELSSSAYTSTYKFTDNFTHTNLAFGAQWGNSWYFRAEADAVYTELQGASSSWSKGFALGLGYQW